MKDKLSLRPELNIEILEHSSVEENFQNQTLRPILKLQNEIFVSVFNTYALNRNVYFNTLNLGLKQRFLTESIQKDLVLKNTMIGITIGMFTSKELEFYLLQTKIYNKRIISMVIERIKSQMK